MSAMLVTGGTGYLGQAIVRALVARGHGRSSSRAAPRRRNSPAPAVDGDVRDRARRCAAARGCDAICHGPRWSSIWRRIRPSSTPSMSAVSKTRSPSCATSACPASSTRRRSWRCRQPASTSRSSPTTISAPSRPRLVVANGRRPRCADRFDVSRRHLRPGRPVGRQSARTPSPRPRRRQAARPRRRGPDLVFQLGRRRRRRPRYGARAWHRARYTPAAKTPRRCGRSRSARGTGRRCRDASRPPRTWPRHGRRRSRPGGGRPV